ncbi:hypothetical protein [Ketogulonicigenium vulgare]|uniref:Lipoyl-binding domain-containing protein n=1 Tax=Ketogulonicigenium vulgare (strain WSH-001) TaxID=759362 RepID=F9Y8L3_KETVW|nr:hypothetical protein [Ketogulonicigenium vulgare]ADO42999.1 hypothetical protein EIO_1883 [Ketogulonicigenium vulgare Y25]AEM41182.1 hypothetical protein KVU_1343 [Ketogulonicigenium vulgare WSH-001]ALJ81325.1 hypothetical protein KVH_09095 [Ketogulonicigenium vulgare]ANW34058.1 hypothetical protein KvSKV_09050 [Ketogulonicigenium vulgare]AOZ54909.1 hypothetical protein KVC_1902 [Ketogulonicigenium vulgare]
MFTAAQRDTLLDVMRRTGTTAIYLRDGDKRLSLTLGGEAPAIHRPSQTQAAVSPAIGRVLPRGLDDGLAALQVGDAVNKGEVLVYVAQGLIRHPVTAPVTGTLATLTEAAIVGFGDTIATLTEQGA